MRSLAGHSSRHLVAALGRLRTEQNRLIQQVSSGRRINQPADDPAAAALATDVRSKLEMVRTDTALLALARRSLTASDDSFVSMQSRLERAIEIGAQNTASPVDSVKRKTLAAELRAITSGLLSDGNHRLDGYSLFAGGQTLSPSFSLNPDGSFAYTGDRHQRTLDLEDEAIVVNISGDRILTEPLNAGTSMEALADAIERGHTAAVRAAITQVEGLRQQIASARADAGLTASRLDDANITLLRRTEQLTASLGELEDADLLEVATELSKISQFIETSLASGNVTTQATLLEFLA